MDDEKTQDGGTTGRLLRRAGDLARAAGEQLGRLGAETAGRVSERSVRLAITGLSRSGKTVAATAIVHNLLRAVEHPELLPFLSVVAERRLIGAKLVERGDLHLPSFPYRQSLALLTGEPPAWPASTERINRSRLALRFRPGGGLARLAQSRVTLHLDIVDYPGEWLLDLPMLHQSFDEWSAAILARLGRPPRDRLAGEFLAFIAALDPDAAPGEETIAAGTQLYRRFLDAARDEGLTLLQPGRFVKPGREVAENAPLMAFFPLPAGKAPGRQSLHGELARRYAAYRDHLVRPLYRDHFARADRQVVFVDVFKALAGGFHALADMRDALSVILRSFDHGPSGWLRHLFAPRIERVLFAATKCDHVPLAQHPNLQSLLNELVTDACADIRFDGARTQACALAAIRCTEDVLGERDGETLAMIRGRPVGRSESIALFPGTIPPRFPPARAWKAESFRFLDFLPAGLEHAETDGLPHIGLDHALEFLLGDRLR